MDRNPFIILSRMRTSPRRKQAHVTLPVFYAGRYVTIRLLDGSDHGSTFARMSGNAAHAYVDASWIGKPVTVSMTN